jgi:rubrerythrin
VLRAHLAINLLFEVKRMLSQMPIKVERVSKKLLDCEILRVAIIAELDAINLYEQLAAVAGDENVKKVLLEVAREEKTHLGEFQTLLLKVDAEQVQELEKGRKEVEELTR